MIKPKAGQSVTPIRLDIQWIAGADATAVGEPDHWTIEVQPVVEQPEPSADSQRAEPALT